jgi:transcriptional regulator with XRE-family HTH domain
MEKIIHQGRNVKRFREMLGIKQEALAVELGDDWNQRKISLLEQKEVIEQVLLERVSKALKVPPEAIKHFDDEKAINIISNNSFENCTQPASIFLNSTINLVEKWMEALEENKKLYTALLREKDEKIELLQNILNNLK